MGKGFSEFRPQMDAQSAAPVEETVGLDYVHAVEDADVDAGTLQEQESERKEAFAQHVWESLEEMRVNGQMDVKAIEEALDTAAELGFQKVDLLYALRNLRNENPTIRALGYVELARRKAGRAERSRFDDMEKILSATAMGFEFSRSHNDGWEREMLEMYARGGAAALTGPDAPFIPIFRAIDEAGVDMQALFDQTSPEGAGKILPTVKLELRDGLFPVLPDVDIAKAIRYAPMLDKRFDQVTLGTRFRFLISLKILNKEGQNAIDGRPSDFPSTEVVSSIIAELLKTPISSEEGVVAVLDGWGARLDFDKDRDPSPDSGWSVSLPGKVGENGRTISVRLNERDS